MGAENERPPTFVEWVLALLEERFPWLGSGQDEPASVVDTWRIYVQCTDDSNGAGTCIDSLGEGRLL